MANEKKLLGTCAGTYSNLTSMPNECMLIAINVTPAI